MLGYFTQNVFTNLRNIVNRAAFPSMNALLSHTQANVFIKKMHVTELTMKYLLVLFSALLFGGALCGKPNIGTSNRYLHESILVFPY